jgi:exosortase O
VTRLDLLDKPQARLAANLSILLLWAVLYRPVFPYLGIIFTRQEFRTNQIALLAVLVLIIAQVRRGGLRISPFDLPQLHLPGLALLSTCSAAFIAAERWLDINTLSATLCGLAAYGLLGLWMEPARWRQGLPAALLLVGVLPFGEHMETFIGYPLRLATARVVSSGMAALGIPNLGVDTILVFENGLSQVDSPCSGVKSLWTGGLFMLAATWVDSRPLNRRWLLASILFVCLLLASNLLRVAVLVFVGQAAGWRLLAEMLHVPLGIIGFAAACLALVGMLRWAGRYISTSPHSLSDRLARPAWLAPTLGVFLLLLALLYTPRLQPAAAATLPQLGLDFPAGLSAQPWALSQDELDWLTSRGSLPVSAARWRFEWQGISGSLLFVYSDTWRAQHRPERCFTVYGLEVQGSQPYLAAPDFPLRQLTLGRAGDKQALYTAAYWLQSSDKITEDYAARIWDDLAPQPQPWVLVTVLLDQPLDPHQPAVLELFGALRASVQSILETNHEPQSIP